MEKKTLQKKAQDYLAHNRNSIIFLDDYRHAIIYI